MSHQGTAGERTPNPESSGATMPGAAEAHPSRPPAQPLPPAEAGTPPAEVAVEGSPAEVEVAAEAGEAPLPSPSAELTEIRTQLHRLAELFEERLAYDRFKEEQITQLHEELQGHRRDLLGRALRPLLLGLIRLHDDLGRAREDFEGESLEELTRERFAGVLEGFEDDLVLLLDRHGVERSEASGDRFDPRVQTALRRVPTEDGARVGRIARRLRPGFELDGTPLKKERVEVFVAAAAGPSTIENAAAPVAPDELSEEESR